MTVSRTGRECDDHQLLELDSDDSAVLLIDHDLVTRQSVAQQLSKGGCRVAGFSSNEEFLSAVSSRWSGCAIAEFIMPDEDGVQLLRALDARSIVLPVIFLSAVADARGVVKAFAAGAFDFFQRPFDPPELLDCVRRATEWDRANRRMRWQLAEIERRRAHLSDRQAAILTALVAGHTEDDIYTAVNIDAATFDEERNAVFDKLGVESLVELAGLEVTRDRLRERIGEGRRLVRIDPSHLDVSCVNACPAWLQQPPKTALGDKPSD